MDAHELNALNIYPRFSQRVEKLIERCQALRIAKPSLIGGIPDEHRLIWGSQSEQSTIDVDDLGDLSRVC